MEIITGVERRWRWRDEEKLRILAELDEPGARFNDVAPARCEPRPVLAVAGRAAARRAGGGGSGLRAVAHRAGIACGATDPENDADNRIEILLPNGTAVRVAEGISDAVLRRVLTALRG